MSAYGGVIGLNREVDAETAREIAKTFVEAIAAPGYSAEAVTILTAKKNLRLMRVAAGMDALVVKTITGGFLAQTADDARLDRASAAVKSRRPPTDEEWQALEFGWKVAKHVKSNAIVYARPGAGGGRGSWADEPRGLGQVGRDESDPAAGQDGGGIGCLLPFPRWRGGSGQIRSYGIHSAGRVRCGMRK